MKDFASRIFARGDITNTIRANVLTVILTAAAHQAGNVEYIRGSLATAHGLALAFGIDWAGVLADIKCQAALQGLGELLDAATGHDLVVK